MNDRAANLEAFASQTTIQGQVMAPATITHAPPPALVHGAQKMVVSRDEGKVLQRIRTLAHAAGDAWYYRIPFKDRRTGKTTYVEGPSIKLANDVARLYGNCDVDEWVSGEGIDYWEFTARFIDLETGYSLTRVFRQRKSAAAVGNDASRNAEIGFAIGASKAIRNAVTNALQTFTDFAFEEARNALVAQVGKDIERWRKEVSERIGAMVDLKRVEAVIGRPVKDWLAPDIAQIAAMGKTIKDGMATIDETFPPLQRQEHASTKDQLDKASEATPTSETGAAGDGAPEKGASSGASSDGRDLDEAARTGDAPDHNTRTWSPALQKEAIDKMLSLASDTKLDTNARLEALENAAPHWEEQLNHDFFTALVKTCIAVVKGHTSEADGRKVLETFK